MALNSGLFEYESLYIANVNSSLSIRLFKFIRALYNFSISVEDIEVAGKSAGSPALLHISFAITGDRPVIDV